MRNALDVPGDGRQRQRTVGLDVADGCAECQGFRLTDGHAQMMTSSRRVGRSRRLARVAGRMSADDHVGHPHRLSSPRRAHRVVHFRHPHRLGTGSIWGRGVDSDTQAAGESTHVGLTDRRRSRAHRRCRRRARHRRRGDARRLHRRHGHRQFRALHDPSNVGNVDRTQAFIAAESGRDAAVAALKDGCASRRYGGIRAAIPSTRTPFGRSTARSPTNYDDLGRRPRCPTARHRLLVVRSTGTGPDGSTSMIDSVYRWSSSYSGRPGGVVTYFSGRPRRASRTTPATSCCATATGAATSTACSTATSTC